MLIMGTDGTVFYFEQLGSLVFEPSKAGLAVTRMGGGSFGDYEHSCIQIKHLTKLAIRWGWGDYKKLVFARY